MSFHGKRIRLNSSLILQIRNKDPEKLEKIKKNISFEFTPSSSVMYGKNANRGW